jgi:hypothetical protein
VAPAIVEPSLKIPAVNPFAEAAPGARPCLILFVQAFGDLANFNPHVHVLAADDERTNSGYL